MNRTYRLLPAFRLCAFGGGLPVSLAAIALCAATAQAAESEPAAAPEASSPSVVATSPAIPAVSPAAQAAALASLNIEVDGIEDADAVKHAILRELSQSAQPLAQTAQVHVSLEARDNVEGAFDLRVVLQSGTRAALERRVAAPARPDDIPELTALLVGNLARDQAAGLFASQTQPEPKPVSAKKPVAKPEVPSAAEPALNYFPASFSLFYPLAVPIDPANYHINFELGLLYGHVGALTGIGINASGLLHVSNSSTGLLVSGLGIYSGGPIKGLTASGLLAAGGEDLTGISLAGLASIQGGASQGIQAAGLANLSLKGLTGMQAAGLINAADETKGLQASGLLNLTFGEFKGLQAAGLGNLALKPATGLQAAGLVNLASEGGKGLQTAGLANVAGEEYRGLQLSVINIGGDVTGAQVGVINVASNVKGVQVGVINVASKVEGASIGVVPYVHQGHTQIAAWYDTYSAMNLGVRLQNGWLYFMPTVSYDPNGVSQGLGKRQLMEAGLIAGLRHDFGPVYADLSAGNTPPWIRSNGGDVVELRYRALVGVQIFKYLGVFVGGGVRHRPPVGLQHTTEVKPIFNAGLDIL